MIKKILGFFGKIISSDTKNKNDKEVQKEQSSSTKTRNDSSKTRRRENINQPRRNNNRRKPEQNKKPAEPQVPEWDLAKFDVEPEEGRTRFHDLGLSNEIMHALADLDFKYCTPIQAEVLPHTLKGKDAVGQAQTGTGKTAAFLISIYYHLLNNKLKGRKPKATPRALIVAPTRELVIQIERDAEKLARYLNMNVVTAYGGMDYKKQINNIRDGYLDLLIATPGRLIDFIQNKVVKLHNVEILVLDEADRMLDMGFIPDVRKIVRTLPHKEKRQTLFFTATLNMTVERLAHSWTRDAVTVVIEPDHVASDNVDQKVFITTGDEKIKLLYNLIKKQNLTKVMTFTNRKDEAKKVAEELFKLGLEAKMISGDVDQKKRIKTLQQFKDGEIAVLVATDVASRGLHIDGVSHVVNYSLPDDPEDYVHRIGRTGRAGAKGISVSFASEFDSFNIPAIEKYLGNKFEYEDISPELLEELPEYSRELPKAPPQQNKRPSNRRRPSGNRSNNSRNSRSGGNSNTDNKKSGDRESSGKSENKSRSSSGNRRRSSSDRQNRSRRPDNNSGKGTDNGNKDNSK